MTTKTAAVDPISALIELMSGKRELSLAYWYGTLSTPADRAEYAASIEALELTPDLQAQFDIHSARSTERALSMTDTELAGLMYSTIHAMGNGESHSIFEYAVADGVVKAVLVRGEANAAIEKARAN